MFCDFAELWAFLQSHPGCPFPIYRARTPPHAPAAATESNYHSRHNKVLKVVASILCKKKKKLGRREPDERRLVSVSLLERNGESKEGERNNK